MNTIKMSSSKYDVEKFCGKGNFSLWQRRMKDLLIQQGSQGLTWEGEETGNDEGCRMGRDG